MIIRNGKDTPLNALAGTVPWVGGALTDYFQPMVFAIIGKVVQGFLVQETADPINFQGVMQPYTDRQLAILPDGERAWSWVWLHADPSLTLQVDAVVSYLGTNYRVKSRKDFRIYGYVEYSLVQDWTGSGPKGVG